MAMTNTCGRRELLRFLLCAAACCGCAEHKANAISVNPEYVGKVTIVSSSSDGHSERYVLRSETGIFSFDIVPPPKAVKKMTLVLLEQRRLEGLGLTTRAGKWVNLGCHPPTSLHEGVQIEMNDDTFRVDLTGPALDLVRQGGRLQVIRQYLR